MERWDALRRIRAAIVLVALGVIVYVVWFPLARAARDIFPAYQTPLDIAVEVCSPNFYAGYADPELADLRHCYGEVPADYLRSEELALALASDEINARRRSEGRAVVLRDAAQPMRKVVLTCVVALAAFIVAPVFVKRVTA